MDLCRLHTELAQAYDRVERVWEARHGNKQKFANRLVEGEFHGVLEQANLSQIDWSGGGVQFCQESCITQHWCRHRMEGIQQPAVSFEDFAEICLAVDFE